MTRRGDGGPDGVLVVDKPAGMTSHDVVDVVRRRAGTRKVGHTGTLDPAATGVLVLCLGRATRLVRFLQASRKTYHARLVLGVETDSQDADGQVVAETDASALDEGRVCGELMRFVGRIDQVPPMVSAVKVDGERLHVRARRGEVVERAPRTVTVHDLVVESFTPGRRAEVEFLLTCDAGTYVRTIGHDVGRALGVGGHLTALRRLANGSFTVDDAVSLAELDPERVAQALLSPAEAVRGLPSVLVEDRDAARRLVQGGQLPTQGHEGPYVALHEGRLLGVYVDEDGRGRPQVVLTRPDELSA